MKASGTRPFLRWPSTSLVAIARGKHSSTYGGPNESCDLHTQVHRGRLGTRIQFTGPSARVVSTIARARMDHDCEALRRRWLQWWRHGEGPALRRLLADIEAGRVDCVVVYKVDRLSRRLTDFARMVEIFDKHNVSCISVTQQINTATSMGRLMLNVLFSFAQFERELVSERTRDKIAATRRKGSTLVVGQSWAMTRATRSWWSMNWKPSAFEPSSNCTSMSGP